MEIQVRYGLIDRDDVEQDQDYGTLEEAQAAAGDQFGIVRNVYSIELQDCTLVSAPGTPAPGVCPKCGGPLDEMGPDGCQE